MITCTRTTGVEEATNVGTGAVVAEVVVEDKVNRSNKHRMEEAATATHTRTPKNMSLTVQC